MVLRCTEAWGRAGASPFLCSPRRRAPPPKVRAVSRLRGPRGLSQLLNLPSLPLPVAAGVHGLVQPLPCHHGPLCVSVSKDTQVAMRAQDNILPKSSA